MDWYSFRGIFKSEIVGATGNVQEMSLVEDRVVLLLAESFDEAIRLGEIEADSYAKNVWPNANGELVKTRYLGSCDVFAIKDLPAQGVEVYSSLLLRQSSENDETIVERLLGSEDEKGPTEIFEPDFDRLLEMNREKEDP